MAASNDGFIEITGYYCTIYTDQTEDGWWAWVTFERKSDFVSGKALVAAIRHRIPGNFASQSDATDHGYDYARRCIQDGEVGL